jgi:hypothetical protein
MSENTPNLAKRHKAIVSGSSVNLPKETPSKETQTHHNYVSVHYK